MAFQHIKTKRENDNFSFSKTDEYYNSIQNNNNNKNTSKLEVLTEDEGEKLKIESTSSK